MAEATLTSTATVVGGTHFFFSAPLGTALPTAAPTEAGEGLDDAFVCVGYTSDQGAAFNVDTQTNDLFASQSLDPLRTIVQSQKATVELPMIEWSATSLALAFGGGSVSAVSGGYKYEPPAAGTLAETSGVLDIVDGGYITRLVVERGLVAGSVKAQLVKNAFGALPIVFTALAPVDLPTAWHIVGTNPALAPVGS